MKTQLTSLFFLVACHSYSQSATVEKSVDQDRVTFSVSREANIYCYLIEGADDTVNFEIIGKIISTGNSVLPRTYVYDNTDVRYKNYRIKQVDMNRLCVSTQIIYAPRIKRPVEKREKRLQAGI